MNGLKRKRKEKRLTLREVADAMDVALITIWNWEHGEREPNFDNLKKLAAFFECTIDELM